MLLVQLEQPQQLVDLQGQQVLKVYQALQAQRVMTLQLPDQQAQLVQIQLLLDQQDQQAHKAFKVLLAQQAQLVQIQT